jgi:hypothetical protein
MHTITAMPPRELISTPHKLPWLEPVPDDIMLGEFRSFDDSDGKVYHDDMMEDNL